MYIDIHAYAAVVVEGFAIDDTVAVTSRVYELGDATGYLVTPQLSSGQLARLIFCLFVIAYLN